MDFFNSPPAIANRVLNVGILDMLMFSINPGYGNISVIQYALDKPGVLTVLPGIRGKEDLNRILGLIYPRKVL